MNWLAPAKINLSLRVLGRRADGFHEIETFMVPITLADEITLEATSGESGGIELICSDPTLPTGRDNLAYRAAECFLDRIPTIAPSLRLILDKRVPHGAGLGGGSSDAATVLLALNEFCGAPLSTGELAALAGELGSDVPFFVYRSAAVCRGRGEQVQPVDFDETLPLLLLKPPFPVPTPLAYQRWQASLELPGVRYTAQEFPWGELINDLERPVYEKYLLLAEMKTWLLTEPGVAGALMSGSGSTVFAVLDHADRTATLVERAQAEFGPLWIDACTTLPRQAGDGTHVYRA